jgi:hypothetical protein
MAITRGYKTSSPATMQPVAATEAPTVPDAPMPAVPIVEQAATTELARPDVKPAIDAGDRAVVLNEPPVSVEMLRAGSACMHGFRAYIETDEKGRRRFCVEQYDGGECDVTASGTLTVHLERAHGSDARLNQALEIILVPTMNAAAFEAAAGAAEPRVATPDAAAADAATSEGTA